MTRSAGLRNAAMPVALIALVLAMAGASWALPGRAKVEADDLAKGSVGNRALASGAVEADALAKGAVDRQATAAGSVGRAEITTNAVREAEIMSSSVGNGELKPVNKRTANVRVAPGGSARRPRAATPTPTRRWSAGAPTSTPAPMPSRRCCPTARARRRAGPRACRTRVPSRSS